MSRLAATADAGNPGFAARDVAVPTDIDPGDQPDGRVTGETPGELYASQSREWEARPHRGLDILTAPLFRFIDAMRGPARDTQYESAYAWYEPARPTHDDRNMSGLHVVIGPYPWLVAIEGDQDDLSPEDYSFVRRVPPDAWDAPLGVE